MTTPTCPFCGETRQNQWYADIWYCDTTGRVCGELKQGQPCRIRQLEAENARNAADLEGALQVIANADLTMDDMFTLPMKHEIRIAQLEAENARLREALLHIRDSNWCGDDCRRIARTALEGNREKAE